MERIEQLLTEIVRDVKAIRLELEQVQQRDMRRPQVRILTREGKPPRLVLAEFEALLDEENRKDREIGRENNG